MRQNPQDTPSGCPYTPRSHPCPYPGVLPSLPPRLDVSTQTGIPVCVDNGLVPTAWTHIDWFVSYATANHPRSIKPGRVPAGSLAVMDKISISGLSSSSLVISYLCLSHISHLTYWIDKSFSQPYADPNSPETDPTGGKVMMTRFGPWTSPPWIGGGHCAGVPRPSARDDL
jgi:hypothetical protein